MYWRDKAMTEPTTKKDALIKIRNEQVEMLCRNEVDSKLFFQRMIGTNPKEHEEARKKKAQVEETIKIKKDIISIIDKMLTEDKRNE